MLRFVVDVDDWLRSIHDFLHLRLSIDPFFITHNDYLSSTKIFFFVLDK